jgi:hypothetical protein
VSAKQVVYIYNGDQESADFLLDLEDEIPEPEQGEMITRDGQTWTIGAVRWTQDSGDPPVPVMQIFLSSESNDD